MGGHLTAASRRWCDGLPPVTAEVECGGEAHRITWQRGKLVLEDHDLLAERSLAALGAPPPTCVEVLGAWQRIRGTEQLSDLLLRDKALSPKELSFRRGLHEEQLKQARAISPPMSARFKSHPMGADLLKGWERHVAEQIAVEERVWALTLLEALPTELRRTLALSVLVGTARRWGDHEFRRRNGRDIEAALSAIAFPLFEQSARRWRRNLRPYALFVAEAWVLAPGERPTCAAWADTGGAFAALSLPISWFTDVWARGVALVDGCFVLAVEGRSASGKRLDVLALRWERQGRGGSKSVEAPAVVMRGRDGVWRLGWS